MGWEQGGGGVSEVQPDRHNVPAAPLVATAPSSKRAKPTLRVWSSLLAAVALLVLLIFAVLGEGLTLRPIASLPRPLRQTSAATTANLAITAIAMDAPDDGWAFASYTVQPTPNANGTYGSPPVPRAAVLHYDGTVWRVFAPAPPIYIASISMVSRDEGWAAGPGGLLHYHNGRWSAIIAPGTPTPTPDHPSVGLQFQALAMAGADDGWAGGQDIFYRYHDGAWVPVALPIKATHFTIFSISMRSTDEGWAVGEQFDAQYNRTILALHYTGGRWVESGPGAAGSFYGVAAVGPGEAWAVGAADPGIGPGLILHFGNGRWTPAKSPTPNILMRVAMLSPGEGWAVGDGAVTLHYSGGAWTREGTIIHGVRLDGLALASPDEGWAVGEGLSSSGGAVMLHRAHGAWAPYPLDGIAAQLQALAG